MHKRMTTVAIIPARKGSKGILNKNLADLNGKPLVQYSIEVAKEAESIDFVVVTTDWLEVKKLSESLDVDYIRDRPANLSSDTASMAETIDDVLAWLATEYDVIVDAFVLLQPTSPLRVKSDIDNSVAMLTNEYDSVIGVSKIQEHPFECVEVTSDGSWNYLIEPSSKFTRRQDYDRDFNFINGAIYTVKADFFKKSHLFVSKRTYFYLMPKERSVDIDHQYDLDLANFLLSRDE